MYDDNMRGLLTWIPAEVYPRLRSGAGMTKKKTGIVRKNFNHQPSTINHKPLVRLCLLVFVVSILLQTAAQSSMAAQFAYASLRLNRSAANSALSGFVCATPSGAGAGTEDSVIVTFPTNFSINTTASNWTVSTSGIPAGSTAWPGIGTATAVSGKAVTFPSNDLTNGSARYCFAYTGASSTTGSSTGSQEGTLTTKNSSNTTIDQSVVAVSIGNDQVSLSATVPASASDFSADIEQTSPASTNVNQNETITYQITYGSSLSYATDITVRASWSQGTISGSGTPSLDIADYVVGSASTGYGSTTPVIDTVNRTISWEISDFPANTSDQTVTFQLITTEAYTSSGSVTFETSGKIIGPGIETTPSTVTNTYTYQGAATATPTPTPGSGGGGATATPGPGSTSTPTPTGTQTIRILDVEISQISSTYADVFVQLSVAAPIQIRYGTSTKSLTQRVTAAQARQTHTIRLSDLEPDTVYYFQVAIPNQSTVSEFFTFKTAKDTDAATIDKDSIIIVSNNVILFDQFVANTAPNAVVVLPGGSVFQVKFGFQDASSIKTIQLAIHSQSDVLGVSTFVFPSAEAAGLNTTMVKVSGGEYLGKLRIPETPGMYELTARILDEDGHLLNEKVIQLKSTPPMKIMNKKGRPIERAEVLLEYFDRAQKRFVVASSQALPIQNPSYSDFRGIVSLTLPQAQYRAKISAFGYKDKTVIFTIGPEEGQDYPQVKLEKAAITPVGFIHYLDDSITELLKAFLAPFYIFLHSPVFFTVLASVTGLIFVALILAAVISRSILKLWPGFLKRNKSTRLSGQVMGSNKNPIRQATVHVYDGDDKLVKMISTNNQGRFTIQLEGIKRIQVVKEGFVEAEKSVDEKTELTIELESDESKLEQVTHSFGRTIMSWLRIGFQVLLYGIVLAEILMLIVFPILQVIPVLLVSVINVWMWRQIK